MSDTEHVLGWLSENADFTLGCFFDRKPIGLATIDDPRLARNPPDDCSALKVVDIVTHPLSNGAASILIERGAILSQERGYDGVLELIPSSADARGAYHAMGFVNDGEKMRLTPSSPENRERWTLHAGEWRLKKYVEKRAPTGMADIREGGG